jgi:hypothetical protein
MHTPGTVVEHAHAKILVNALEHRMSRGDTNNEFVDHELVYASK